MMNALNKPWIAAIVTSMFIALFLYSLGYSFGYKTSDVQELRLLQDAALKHRMTKGEFKNALNYLYGEQK